MTPDTADYRQRTMVEPPARVLPRTTPQGDQTRRALLAAAHDLLATEGPSALTVRRIAAAAGMSTMNVYSRFGGKDGVLEELYIDGFARLGDRMAHAPITDDPLDDLRRCGECYQRFARENPTYYSLMFDRAGPEFQPSATAVGHALDTLARLAEGVQRAIDAGALRPADAFATASALWACEHGLASLEARQPDAGARDFDWDVIADMARNAMLRGLACEP